MTLKEIQKLLNQEKFDKTNVKAVVSAGDVEHEIDRIELDEATGKVKFYLAAHEGSAAVESP